MNLLPLAAAAEMLLGSAHALESLSTVGLASLAPYSCLSTHLSS